jgi:3-hydroxy acid dehydrogenase/malonic semialdehyde reductase
MQNFKNKIVLITGANSGIGLACAEQFAKIGAKLIVTARQQKALDTLVADLIKRFNVDVHGLLMDVRHSKQVTAAIENLPKDWQAIDVLVNNAGLSSGLDKIQDVKDEDVDLMIDTNIKGLIYVTRAVLKGMLVRNQGHIINLGSISSRQVYTGGGIYCATKFAVRALTLGTKMDVHGTQLRVTLVDPGMVRTNFANTRFHGDQAKVEAVYQGMNHLVGDDIANTVVYCATLPAHVNISEIQVFPTDQTAAHMVHRR